MSGGLEGRSPLGGAVLERAGGAGFARMRHVAPGVAYSAWHRLSTAFVRASCDIGAGIKAGFEAGAARRMGGLDSRSHFHGIEVHARRGGDGMGGTKADDQCGGEEGESRFHG